MSFFFGRDLWDEIDRVNSQIAQLSQDKDKKSDDCKVETYSYFFPPSDVVEKQDSYVIAIDLPGVKKEDVTMDLHQNKLSVSGSRKPRYLPEEKPQESTTISGGRWRSTISARSRAASTSTRAPSATRGTAIPTRNPSRSTTG